MSTPLGHLPGYLGSGCKEEMSVLPLVCLWGPHCHLSGASWRGWGQQPLLSSQPRLSHPSTPTLLLSWPAEGLTVPFQARSMINQTQPRNQVVQPPLMRASPCRSPCPMSVQPLLGCLWRPENRHLLGSSNDALGRVAEAGWGRPLRTHLSRCQRRTS